MVAFNFKKQFAPEVAAGRKNHTIRQKARCKVGDDLQLYTGMRTRNCQKLMDAVCIAVDNISITPDGPFFGRPGWWPKDREALARNDGFASYEDMRNFFFIEYGDEIFNGYIIMWRPK